MHGKELTPQCEGASVVVDLVRRADWLQSVVGRVEQVTCLPLGVEVEPETWNSPRQAVLEGEGRL